MDIKEWGSLGVWALCKDPLSVCTEWGIRQRCGGGFHCMAVWMVLGMQVQECLNSLSHLWCIVHNRPWVQPAEHSSTYPVSVMVDTREEDNANLFNSLLGYSVFLKIRWWRKSKRQSWNVRPPPLWTRCLSAKQPSHRARIWQRQLTLVMGAVFWQQALQVWEFLRFQIKIKQ